MTSASVVVMRTVVPSALPQLAHPSVIAAPVTGTAAMRAALASSSVKGSPGWSEVSGNANAAPPEGASAMATGPPLLKGCERSFGTGPAPASTEKVAAKDSAVARGWRRLASVGPETPRMANAPLFPLVVAPRRLR